MAVSTGTAKLKTGLVLDTSLDPADGVQQYVIGIGEWLRGQGHDVHYLVGQTKRTDLQNIHSLARNIGVSFNGNRTTIPLPTARRGLSRFLAEQKFDVLHVQTPHSPFMGQKLVLAAGPKTAVIGTFHILPYGRLAAAGNRGLGRWLKPSLRRFDQIVSVSPAAAEFAAKSFGIQTDVLPNVIDYKRFNCAKTLPKYDDGTLTILFLGRLVPRKGCRLMLEAVNQLKAVENLPAFRVVICGRGPLEAKLRQYVQQHGLGNKVEFAGFVSETDKPGYYASADIAVFPSRAGESFGIVLLEAMAGGKAAVLAGDNPGYRSVMSRTELLFDPMDAAELAGKLKQYLLDARQRDDAAKWGRQYAAGFDINKVGPQLVKIYERALRKRSRL
jgi:phosphatidylinositol alpha-mannosyltransferase